MGEIIFPVWLLNISNFSVMICANLLVQSTLIITVGLCIACALKKQGAAMKTNCEGRRLLGEMSGVSQNLHKLH